jgi:hypothetical protein
MTVVLQRERMSGLRAFSSRLVSRRSLLLLCLAALVPLGPNAFQAAAATTATTTGPAARPMSAPAAPAASAFGAQITRSEVMSRARYWYDHRADIPYNMSGTHQDPQGALYRTDCSGYISMAWHLQPPGLDTITLPSVAQPISKDELKSGDILDAQYGSDVNNTGHVALFDRWTSSAHTSYLGYSFGQYPLQYHEIPYPYFHNDQDHRVYKPYRYDNIVDSPVHSGRVSPGLARFAGGTWTFFRSNAAPAPGTHLATSTSEYVTWPGTASTDVPLVGDWQGTGKDSPGLARYSGGIWTFFLSNAAPASGTHVATTTQEYVTWHGTAATDIPIVGDWQGTGKDSPGLARYSGGIWIFYLSNAAPAPGTHLATSTQEYVTWHGTAGTDVPIVGDWQGTGKDSPGLARYSGGIWIFYLSNAAPAPGTHLATSTQEYVTWHGTAATDVPTVGDWEGTGKDSPGLNRYSGGIWLFFRSNAAPAPGTHLATSTQEYVTWPGTAGTDVTQGGAW